MAAVQSIHRSTGTGAQCPVPGALAAQIGQLELRPKPARAEPVVRPGPEATQELKGWRSTVTPGVRGLPGAGKAPTASWGLLGGHTDKTELLRSGSEDDEQGVR